jgi:hypothetical protein
MITDPCETSKIALGKAVYETLNCDCWDDNEVSVEPEDQDQKVASLSRSIALLLIDMHIQRIKEQSKSVLNAFTEIQFSLSKYRKVDDKPFTEPMRTRLYKILDHFRGV